MEYQANIKPAGPYLLITAIMDFQKPGNNARGSVAGLMTLYGVVEIPHIGGLFKNVQMRGAQKTEPRGVYRYTLSGAVCSATQQMSVFQQSLYPQIREHCTKSINNLH